MVQKNCRAKKQSCLKLSVAALSILVAGTAFWNYVSAAEVFPTRLSTLNQESWINLQNATSWLVSKLVTFVKDGLEKSTSQNKFDFFSNAADKINNQSKVEQKESEPIFNDMVSDPNKYYAETLAIDGIISKSDKFYPNNFIRLNEVTKMFVNAYRFKVWYKVSGNAWLTDKSYFDKPMPKYYNTAYEMGLLKWLDNLEDYERFITYYDLEKIIKNFDNQYPNLVNLYYLDIAEWNDNLRRWDVARVVFKTMMLNSNIEFTYDDIVYNEYWAAIQKLVNLWVIDEDSNLYNPESATTRNEFIILIVKVLLSTKDEHLDPAKFRWRIKDLDYNSNLAEYIEYAEEEWFLDYLLETVRWETYFHPNDKITKHEAYYIISKVTWNTFDYDIISADKQYITKWEVAELITNNMDLSSLKSYDVSTSHIWKIIDWIKSLVQLAQWWWKMTLS